MLIDFWLHDSNFQAKIVFCLVIFFFSSASLFLFRADIHLINHSCDFTRSWKLMIIHWLVCCLLYLNFHIPSGYHFAIFGPFCVRRTPKTDIILTKWWNVFVLIAFQNWSFYLNGAVYIKVRGFVPSSLVLHVCGSKRLQYIGFTVLTVLSLLKQSARIEKETFHLIIEKSSKRKHSLFYRSQARTVWERKQKTLTCFKK